MSIQISKSKTIGKTGHFYTFALLNTNVSKKNHKIITQNKLNNSYKDKISNVTGKNIKKKH